MVFVSFSSLGFTSKITGKLPVKKLQVMPLTFFGNWFSLPVKILVDRNGPCGRLKTGLDGVMSECEERGKG